MHLWDARNYGNRTPSQGFTTEWSLLAEGLLPPRTLCPCDGSILGKGALDLAVHSPRLGGRGHHPVVHTVECIRSSTACSPLPS